MTRSHSPESPARARFLYDYNIHVSVIQALAMLAAAVNDNRYNAPIVRHPASLYATQSTAAAIRPALTDSALAGLATISGRTALSVR